MTQASPRRLTKLSLVIADVDGTLVTMKKELTARARAAVAALDAAGIAFAITSGRPPRGMEMLIKPLRITTPIAGFNGGAFVTPDLKPIEEHLLPPDVAREAVQLIRDSGADPWLLTVEDWIIHDPDAPHVAHEQETLRFAPVVKKDFGSLLDKAAKVVGVSDDHDGLKACEKKVQEALGKRASVSRSQPYYLDVTHPAANKGAVVTTLSRMLKIPTEEIATLGDGLNDVLMFARSGFGIAMGNADDEVKDKADRTTASCDDEGFAKAIEQLLGEIGKGKAS